MNKSHSSTTKHLQLDSFSLFSGVDEYGTFEGSISWPSGSTASITIEPGRLNVAFVLDGEEIIQHIPLSRVNCGFGDRPRTYFVCPFCDGRFQKLYLRWGRFRCRECAELNYPSQQMAHDSAYWAWQMDQVLKKEFEIHSKASPDTLTRYTPPRPRGMHRQTYYHKLAKFKRAQMNYMEAFQQECMKVGLIVAAVAALVAGIIYLWNTNDGFREAVTSAWNQIKEVAQVVWGALVTFFTETLPNAITAAIQWFKDLPEKIVEAIQSAPEKIKEWGRQMFEMASAKVKEIVEAVRTFFSELPQKIWDAIIEAVERIREWARQIYETATTKVREIIETVKNFFSELPMKIWNAIISAVDKVREWGQNIYNTAKEKITSMVEAVRSNAAEIPQKLWNAIIDAVEKVAQWGRDLVEKGKQAIRDMIDGIVTKAGEMGSKILSIGSDIVNGVWQGIQDAATTFYNNIKGFFSGLVDKAKEALDINSPSKVFAQIGSGIVEGTIMGIDSMANALNQSIDDLFGDALGEGAKFEASLNVTRSMGGLALAGAAAGGSGNPITVIQNMQQAPGSVYEQQMYAEAMFEQARWQS